MFQIQLDYPAFDEEVEVIRRTTGDVTDAVGTVMTAEEILFFQQLVRRIPLADNVLEYAVRLTGKTRPGREGTPSVVNDFVSWGAGPRAAQFLVLGAKCHAAMRGKYSPDIEDVRAVALDILRHRMFKNYKAEAEGLTIEGIVAELV